MLSYKKLFVFSLCGFIMTVIFGFAAYNSIFEFTIKNQISLHRKNYVRQFYLKYPIALDFRVYFFNVTNPDAVSEGAIPVLNEIGPYCYDLYKERIDVEDDEDEDSLTYSPKDNYIFNQERSGYLSDDDEVTIIHPLLMGMVNYINLKAPHFLPMLDEALQVIFPNTSIYLTGKVKDILFDGVLINCTTRDFSAMSVCSQLKMKIPGMKTEGSDLKFGLLAQKNGTIPHRYKVLRGIKNSEDLGRLVAVDNATKETWWLNDECNKFKGTDGWIFPPFSGSKNQLWMHPGDFCMNLHADFVGESTSAGLTVRKYIADFQNICEECMGSNSCPPKGLIDMTQCIKVPMYISLPHFLRSDEDLLIIQGLNPNEENHITRVLLQETLSMPIEAQIRVQFNFPLTSIEKIRFMQTLPQIIHPVLWIELGVVLNGWLLRTIKAFLYFLMFMEVFKYVSLILSVLGMAYSGYLYLNNKKLYSIKDTIVLSSK